MQILADLGQEIDPYAEMTLSPYSLYNCATTMNSMLWILIAGYGTSEPRQESIRYWRISRAPPMAAPRGGGVKIVEADCHTPSAHAASGGSGSVSCSAPSRSPQ